MRTDKEIVEQTEELALNFMRYFYDQVPIPEEGTKITFRDSKNTRAQRCWLAACFAQELLTQTDVADAAAELEVDPVAAVADAINMIDSLSEGLELQEESLAAERVVANLNKVLNQYLQEG